MSAGTEAEDFAVLFALTGLDPAHHDLDALRAATAKLRALLDRLDHGAGEATDDPLGVFDPMRPL